MDLRGNEDVNQMYSAPAIKSKHVDLMTCITVNLILDQVPGVISRPLNL